MDEMDWTDAAPRPGDRLDLGDALAEALPPGGATLVSGDLGAALAALAPGAGMAGLGADAGDGAVALRIARDRALLCTPAPLGAAEGWRPEGFAVSAADDAWAAVRLSGPGAARVMAEGVSADLSAGSPSAATLFAGHMALVVRRGDAFVVRVERPMAAWLWSWLAGAAHR